MKTDGEELNTSGLAPIKGPHEDAMGLRAYARHVAKTLDAMPSDAGCVVSVVAPWGVGKTSFIAMVKDFLENDFGPMSRNSEHPFTVLKFNPWWLNSSKSLTEAFIKEFASSLLLSEESMVRRIGKEVAKYGDAIGAKIGVLAGHPSIGTVVGKVLKSLKFHELTLEERKGRIEVGIVKSGKRFLFIVDDIDRLPPKQMLEVFNVTKTLGELAGVTYLLAYDAEVANKAVKAALGVDGAQYLDKIIQLPFDIPVWSDDRRVEYLYAKLSLLDVEEGFVEDHEDYEVKARNFIQEIILPYVKTPRNVEQLLASLKLTFPLANKSNADIYQFAAIEALRLFDKTMYRFLSTNEVVVASHLYSDLSKEDLKFLREYGNKNFLLSVFPHLSGKVFSRESRYEDADKIELAKSTVARSPQKDRRSAEFEHAVFFSYAVESISKKKSPHEIQLADMKSRLGDEIRHEVDQGMKGIAQRMPVQITAAVQESFFEERRNQEKEAEDNRRKEVERLAMLASEESSREQVKAEEVRQQVLAASLKMDAERKASNENGKKLRERILAKKNRDR